MKRTLIFVTVVLAGCASGPTPIELAEAKGARLDECMEQRLDCRADFDREWADFTERRPSDEWREWIKSVWLLQGHIDEVFGPAE